MTDPTTHTRRRLPYSTEFVTEPIASLDLNKPIQTRDGSKVRILCTDASCTNCGEPQPIVGIVERMDLLCAWTAEGVYDTTRVSDMDLVNVPAPKTKVLVTVRLYRNGQCRALYPAVRMEGQVAVWGSDFIAEQTIEMEYEEQP